MRALLLCALLALTALGSPAGAGFENRWGIERVAKESQILLVGEVLKIEPAGTPTKMEAGHHPIGDLKATVRVLRIPKSLAAKSPAVGDVITLLYEHMLPNTLQLPEGFGHF